MNSVYVVLGCEKYMLQTFLSGLRACAGTYTSDSPKKWNILERVFRGILCCAAHMMIAACSCCVMSESPCYHTRVVGS